MFAFRLTPLGKCKTLFFIFRNYYLLKKSYNYVYEYIAKKKKEFSAKIVKFEIETFKKFLVEYICW